MPLLAAAYIVLVIAIALYSFYDDRKAKRSVAYLSTDAVVTVVWIYFVLAYFYPRIAEPVGRLLPLLLLLSLAWTAADASREMKRIIAERPASYDPELSPGANLWIDRAVEAGGLLFGILLLTPALIYAVLVIRRTW